MQSIWTSSRLQCTSLAITFWSEGRRRGNNFCSHTDVEEKNNKVAEEPLEKKNTFKNPLVRQYGEWLGMKKSIFISRATKCSSPHPLFVTSSATFSLWMSEYTSFLRVEWHCFFTLLTGNIILDCVLVVRNYRWRLDIVLIKWRRRGDEAIFLYYFKFKIF